MGILDSLRGQLRSVIEWEQPGGGELFHQWSADGDEIKNASKLIVGPGQGCIFVYEGRIRPVARQEGMVDLRTANIPFWTTIIKLMQAFESEHKVGIWFFKQARILNQKWGTAAPVKYEDPKYKFPVALRVFGNYSVQITDPEGFFKSVVAGKPNYSVSDLREVLVGRVAHSIGDYLAEARHGYVEIDAKREEMSAGILARVAPECAQLGFTISDFRIEGTDFDEETKARINLIADKMAAFQAAAAVGLPYPEDQRIDALRDAARNPGTPGMILGVGAGMGLGELLPKTAHSTGAAERLKLLQQLRDEKLIDEGEYQAKRKEILGGLCRAAQAAMARCRNCSGPLPADGPVCAYCGTRNDVDLQGLGRTEAPEAGPARPCPDCGIPLAAHVLQVRAGMEMRLDRCDRCLGLFFDTGELEAVLENLADAPEIDMKALPGVPPAVDQVIRYRKCPLCGVFMNRKNFGARSGVVTDQCSGHGTWLEAGELRRLLEWRRAGGHLFHEQVMKEKAEREAREEEERQQRHDQIMREGDRDYYG